MSQNFAVWICENWIGEIRKKTVVPAIETN